MQGQWIKTHCARFDHGGCGLKVLVESGKATRVLPDDSNPRSKGYVCTKGLSSLERIYHPHRLLYPLKRKAERGAGKFEKISWDEALEYTAMKLNKVKEEFGAQSVAFAQGAPKGPEYLLMMRLANVFGSPTVAGSQHVCHMPRELMGRMTCGFLPVPDYEMPTRCIVVWGSNPFHTNEEGILGIHLKNALKDDKPKLIVIDPYKTDLAQQADLWLQIRPGSDDLLALGILNIIIREGLHDDHFTKEWTTGLDQLKKHIQTYTPKMVSQGTWIPEDKIHKAARLYAYSKPALLHWGNALENNSVNVSQACRTLVILMAVTGNLDVPGGNIRTPLPPVMSLRKFIGMDQFPEKYQRSIARYYGITPRLPLTPGTLLIKSILDEKPYPIKSLFIQGSNPLLSYAGSDKVFQALHKLDFLVVSDLFMTPTAAMADLVLPAATNMEYNDIGHYGLPHGYILARPKIVDPPGECWPDMKIVNELGKRLGLGQFFWKDIQECLEEIVAPSGLNYEQFCQQGILKGEKRYLSHKEGGFPTPSGKVELYSSLMEKGGYDPLPTESLPQDPDETYPLLMINAKPKDFFHSGYRHMESLRKNHGAPSIRIHSRTASKYGIIEGDRVAVISPHGQIHLKAIISESLHPNVVKADYGWWFPEMGEDRIFNWREANTNILTSGDPPFDPVLGTTPLRNIPCRIEKGVEKGVSS